MPPNKVKSAEPALTPRRQHKADAKAAAHPHAKPRPLTRIQREKQDLILEAALDVFSMHGFRGSTIDQIAEVAGMSKPNLLYYFPRKEEIHRRLMSALLDTWLAPLKEMDADGDPVPEIRSYIRRKLEMARDYPRESRLFANEMLQGAPRIIEMLEVDLKNLVDEKGQDSARLDGPGQARPYRPLPPDLLDLGHHPALRRFRRAGARRSGQGSGR
ncbi:MAG: TetR family transcriptional regulator C-terminal domain-containing protein [Opitutus sp.]|nr:TetR family transcriptional regulator C-terminal domain-containing protein [Opitutus sp.]